MYNNIKVAAKPTIEQLRTRLHEACDFLKQAAHMPDADDWTHNNLMDAFELLHSVDNIKLLTYTQLEHNMLNAINLLMDVCKAPETDKVTQIHIWIAFDILRGKPYKGPLYFKDAKEEA